MPLLATRRFDMKRWLPLSATLLFAVAGFAQTGKKTFTGSNGSFQFDYPVSYTFYSSGNIDKVKLLSYIPVCDNNFPRDSDSSLLACVVYPKQKYRGTNFEAAAFQASALANATTATECLTPPQTTESSAPGARTYSAFRIASTNPARVIHGVRFLHGVAVGTGLGHSIASDLYRAFHNGKCYELTINITQSEFANFPEGAVREFTAKDSQDVFRSLQDVLDSFRFLQ